MIVILLSPSTRIKSFCINYASEWLTSTLKNTKCSGKHIRIKARAANGTIGAGVVIRNSTGEWIHGCTHYIGSGEILQAEVWGIFIGLKMAMELHIQKIEVESDSVLAINLLYIFSPKAQKQENLKAC